MREDRPFGNIVILTGAGISKESGIDTFRDADGLWTKVNLEDVATPEGYQRDPEMVLAFYNDRRRGLQGDNIRANAAHAALARLERDWPGEVLLVTQNIDHLHEEAGSKNLIHMHGEMMKARCEACGAVHHWPGDILVITECPGCAETGAMRPHVVWFGEMPFDMDRIGDALAACSIFISIGTSGSVYPAAGFVQEAIFKARAHTVELNMEPSDGATLFAETHYGPATEVVPRYVERLLGG
jgi:NAD-dependent deacetylase